MKKLLSLALVLTMVLALAVPAMAAAPAGFITGEVTQIDKKGYDKFAGIEITANNSIKKFDGFNFVADNKTANAWYIDVTDDISGTLEAAYKIGSAYYVVTFNIDGVGKYWIADSKGSNGANMVKIGALHIHDYIGAVTDPTCLEDGWTTYTCECGDSYYVPIPALGHDFYQEAVGANCDADGYIDTLCNRCDYKDREILPALGHNYVGVVTKEPTCAEKGVKTYTCSRCSDTYNEFILDRPDCLEENLVYSITKKATCTEDGAWELRCNLCGDVNDSGLIPATGHKYDEEYGNSAYYTLPTYEADGYWTFPCLNPDCDANKVVQDVGSMLIHTHVFVTNATVSFINPTRVIDDQGPYEGKYHWSGELTIKLYLSDGSEHEYEWNNYIGVIIDANVSNPDYTYCCWIWSTTDARDLYNGLDFCKDFAVKFTIDFYYDNGVPTSNLRDVFFEEIGDDLICGF